MATSVSVEVWPAAGISEIGGVVFFIDMACTSGLSKHSIAVFLRGPASGGSF